MRTTHKTTQYWYVALKVLLLVLAFGYIVYKIKTERMDVLHLFSNRMATVPIGALAAFVGIATLNWMLEIYKWKIAANTWFQLSTRQALQQCLGAMTASLLTPNRIGEYGAKALYFDPNDRKKVVFLNFVHSSSQMLATLLFGLPALLYFSYSHSVALAPSRFIIFSAAVLLLLVLGYTYRKKQLGLKGFSLENLALKFRKIPTQRKIYILALSMARYIVFSYLFFILLQFFGVALAPVHAAIYIFTMYLLVSILPSFFVLDVVIRGGVAVWLFSYAGVSEIAVLATVFFMWLLNTVVPALLGSYFVLTFKPKSA